MKKHILLPFLALCLTGYSQMPSGESIIKKMDDNMSSENRVFTSKMIIHGKRGDRSVEARTYTVGENKSFTEYLNPARDKGTKMLKLDDQLWIYSPSTDRTIQISGHMLRQSVMGSDMSYEDMMEDPKLLNHYTATVLESTIYEERACWILELNAFDESVSYHKRKLWVDKSRYIPLKEELFAKSGNLLKKTEFSEVKNYNGRWYPTKIVFKDMLKTGEGTEYIIEKIEFDVEMDEYIFSKASLKK